MYSFPYPFFPVKFTEDGTVLKRSQIDNLLAGIGAGATDLFVLSHGWNNNANEAQELYQGLMEQVAKQILAVPGRKFAICGALWPSKRFQTTSSDDCPAGRRQVLETIRRVLPVHHADAEDGSDQIFSHGVDLLIEKLAVQDLLNYATYYEMKARAADVGVRGLMPLLTSVGEMRSEVRVHLIGHSFGCRVVTAAVNALEGDLLRPDTMTLLQGAFSHYGFAVRFDGTNDGAFRAVVARKKTRGPILITHTRNDKAVGVAYAIASRIARQEASAIGDRDDRYGGLGSNGAQGTPEAVSGMLLPCGGGYRFEEESTPYNLNADGYVQGHSDVAKPEVGWAIASAVSRYST